MGIHQGAGVRIGGRRPESARLTGTSAWRELSAAFEVTLPMEKVDLICELRAAAGDAWFDLSSLEIVRAE
jgi:hypothetical protein